ncbi:MAG: DEAD/DEAH box helicase [Deltaproteobacteria bacterium]|nr:DEAD/DEAH box helicase [Deltaproteobacteria bacterium]MBW2051910.1 DEAD/DEAH box helicase [Deltaproteobacteria bacterium]MBW2140970.1 DEAD/DEAH box helicase [Deltaproteobacteria bacterium]MBW2322722.1 DEAD/DEAH box helicase [Deltaproteobacteria bacterium]
MNSAYKGKKTHQRPAKNKRAGSIRRSGESHVKPFTPRLNEHLKPIFKEIGTPRNRQFVPDPFQIEALKKLQAGDVVVSVPTGAGKTYVAVEAMAELLEKGGKAWYASPLKALSNSKFFEFSRRFGSERVGLLTGDHKVNPNAPLIVGTTEILRNQLYDAMNRGEDIDTGLVIMDEAHYLGDSERGVVWEEVIIYLPIRVRLLLLSATVANAQEIAGWISFVRGGGNPSTVVTHERPVPLYPLFLFPDGELAPLEQGRHIFPKVKHFLRKKTVMGRRNGRNQISFGRILKVLDMVNLLPAIFFLKSRADCDLALSRCFGGIDYSNSDQLTRLRTRTDELLEKYPFLKTHPHLKYLRQLGIAAHHAGHLPHWKLIIEQLMQEGLLFAIFSTSTVAAGVNFPARTVVISQSDRFNGREFSDLSATELLQMTGRAGRRGMDRVGFAVVVPGPFQDVQLIYNLFNSSPEPIKSQMQINFSMVLNLLLSRRPEEIKPLLNLSLAAFQQHRPESESTKSINRITDRLTELLKNGSCSGPEQALFDFQRIRELRKESRRLAKLKPRLAQRGFLQNALSPGRLFENKEGKIYAVIHHQERRGRNGVQAVNIKKARLLKKGQLHLKWIPFDRVALVLATQMDLQPEMSADEIVKKIRAAATQDHVPMEMDQIALMRDSALLSQHEKQVAAIETEMRRLPCNTCQLAKNCMYDRNSKVYKLLMRLAKLRAETRESAQLIWSSFFRHLKFLQEEGFVTTDDELTEDGKWAAKLRLDHPLVIASGIRAHAWPENDPVLLAAIIAPFVMDNDKQAEPLGTLINIPPELAPAWFYLIEVVGPLIRRQRERGFDIPRLNLRAALAIYSWATEGEWSEVVRLYGQDEGDLAMLAFRVADNLRQFASLSDTHPDLAASARRATDLILKEPVTIPL